jgi:hypothetical protein
MTGDGSLEIDHGRRMTLNLLLLYEDIAVMRIYAMLEIITLISNYEFSTESRYACLLCTGGMAPPSMIQGTIQSCVIKQLHTRVSIPNTIRYLIPSHIFNSDTAQAVRD